MKSKLICISGPDGTGKSTQIALLIDSLKNAGYTYEYRWLRFHHLFSLPLLGLARLLGLSEVVTLDNGDKIGYHYFYKSKIISNLYKASMFLDTLIFTTYKVYIPTMLFNKRLVCDRFIYDTIVDLMISTDDNQIYKKLTGKLLLALIPDESNIIVLITNEEYLISRREDLKHDKTLKQKIIFYSVISDTFDIPIIDASMSVYKIQNTIVKKIGF